MLPISDKAPYRVGMNHQDETLVPPPPGWIATIEEGEADLAAGHTVPAATVLAELRAANVRMTARLGIKAPDAA